MSPEDIGRGIAEIGVLLASFGAYWHGRKNRQVLANGRERHKEPGTGTEPSMDEKLDAIRAEQHEMKGTLRELADTDQRIAAALMEHYTEAHGEDR